MRAGVSEQTRADGRRKLTYELLRDCSPVTLVSRDAAASLVKETGIRGE
jgi:hypothetical protein